MKEQLVLKEIYEREEAISRRLKALEPGILGLRWYRYRVLRARKVYVPYYLFEYEVDIALDKSILTGAAAVDMRMELVTDSFEGRSYLVEEALPLLRRSDAIEAAQITCHIDEAEAAERALRYLRWKVIGKVYREIPQIKEISRKQFYRPMWEMELKIGQRTVKKMAPADGFQTSKESVKGIKSR